MTALRVTSSVLAVPGIDRVDQTFLRSLAAMVDRHSWDIDGIAGVISHESRFDPAAHNPQPGQSATGLIQFIESTAHSLGTTTAALRTMSALQQLPYVEKFFARTIHKVPTVPEDYILATFGRADMIGAHDGDILDRRDSSNAAEAQRYRVNAALDHGQKGFITVGDLRASLRTTLASAHGKRIAIATSSSGSSPGSSSSGPGLIALVGLFFCSGR